MALIDRISDVNRTLPNREYYRFHVNDCAVGFVDTQLLDELAPDFFDINNAKKRIDCRFVVDERENFERSIEQFFRDYFTKHDIGGWRDEKYAVSESFNSPALFLAERATLSFLGVTGYGVHINGYVEKADGIHMWIAKRSINKPTSPGKLDQIAAGGIPHGISPLENVIKECEEEASIPRYLAKHARAVSAVSYIYDLPVGMRPDVSFNYDLRLPEDFIPQVNDDEVESFSLRHIDDVLAQVACTQDFKFNCAMVIIDFAIRHGIITPEHPDYVTLCAGMNVAS